MKRREENTIIVDKMIEESARNPSGSYERMVVLQLSTIAVMLTDISKSLAIIADRAESEEENG